MAKIIRIVSRRQAHTGIACINERSIVVWGDAAKGDTAEALMEALSDARQMLRCQAYSKSNDNIIAEVCDKLFPGNWAFTAQGGTIEF